MLGFAGCCATVFHDSVMNPAEGMYVMYLQLFIMYMYICVVLHMCGTKTLHI